MARINKRPLSLEEVIIRGGFDKCSPYYLQQYIKSYRAERGFIRSFLEDSMWTQEPLVIRAAREAYDTKLLKIGEFYIEQLLNNKVIKSASLLVQ